LPPPKSPTPNSIGRYQLKEKVATGGMGEVHLAHDPICRRDVALKIMRPDLKENELLHKRFMREAWVTGRLSHPGVIPVYDISPGYYTMPYVEGRTLKELLRAAIEEPDDPAHQIPHLMRIFSRVCEVVAYAHEQNILHRDLKPENIMVGRHGEVYVLDWGLAKWGEDLATDDAPEMEPELTQPGKIFGTLSHLPPECAAGTPTSSHSDLYALGVMLYQILALRVPFKRPSLAEFRKTGMEEQFVSPAKVAPYRDVPKMLARIARRALRKKVEDRYPSVQAMLSDIRNYIEGRSEWFPIATLDPEKLEHWSFHENIHITPHMALTRTLEASEWVSVMISRDSFPGNVALRGQLRIGEHGSGVGLLLRVPHIASAQLPDRGLCLWLGSDLAPGTKLFSGDLQVFHDPHLTLERSRTYDFLLESDENSVRLTLDGEHRFQYVSYLPLTGGRVGLLYRDADFALHNMQVLVGSYSIKVNCLAVPDAFLAEELYDKALAEYRRIAASFPERHEGREALFRAGVTLLEEARHTPGNPAAFDAALEQFAQLHDTAAAPLEYLGKALVYQARDEYAEEGKCFELAFRRYRDHPLLPTLRDHLLYRLHQSSKLDRKATYRFSFFLVRYTDSPLPEQLSRNWEELPFLPPTPEGVERQDMALRLAFWLAKPAAIREIMEEEPGLERHAKWALLELEGGEPPEPDSIRATHHQMQTLLDAHRFDELYALYNGQDYKEPFDAYVLWGLLYQKRVEEAQALIEKYPLERLIQENDIFHFLYGVYLALTEGEEIALIHFSGVLESPFPRTWALFGHHLSDRIIQRTSWEHQAFLWEKRQLARQRALYAHVIDDEAEETKALADLRATFL
jgi:eukaryotic-like serine/threonine-protein kinase